jgi:tRNA(fMet)-specific endonuclease VapC
VYLLDTNICIYLLNRRPTAVVTRLERVGFENTAVSSITVAELRYGAEKSRLGERNKRALETFLSSLYVLNFDLAAAYVYAGLRVGLERQGTPIGPLDTLIAAHAFSLDATLVTNNVSEFRRIPDLKIENWAEV